VRGVRGAVARPSWPAWMPPADELALTCGTERPHHMTAGDAMKNSVQFIFEGCIHARYAATCIVIPGIRKPSPA
jgi:hypothetical protein